MKNLLYFDCETAPIHDVAGFVDAPSAPSNYKDPAKIAAYEAEALQRVVDDAGTDIDLARIVALGFMRHDHDSPDVLMCATEDSERAALQVFWSLWDEWHHPFLVGYNCVTFDMPLILRRSLYLGVTPQRVELSKYRHPDVIDLYELLTFGGMIDRKTKKSLGFYAKRLGIPHDESVSGSDIARLVREDTPESWNRIKHHCADDILTTRAIADRLKVGRETT